MSEGFARTDGARSGRLPVRRQTGGPEVTIEAPAKINLYLEILDRRPDGYHEIDTVMQTVSLSDTLRIRARSDDDFNLSVTGRAEGVGPDESNLVLRAARALLREARARPTSGGPEAGPLGADIEIEKRIPAGSGLGGGSSDAAATLVGLGDLWGGALPHDFERIAAELGSDVPFFLRGGTARCRGRGEVVEALRARGVLWAVLVFSEPLSTEYIYSVFDAGLLTTPPARGTFPWKLSQGLDIEAVGTPELRNSLEAAAFEVRPDLRRIKETLIAAGARPACVSGSGSCVFGVTGSEGRACAAAERVRSSGHEAVVVRSVDSREDVR